MFIVDNINTKIILSGKQMLNFESLHIKDDKSALHYMQKTGRAVYEEVKKHNKCMVLVLYGCGNNGGDGYVVVEFLRQNEWYVSVFSLEESRTDISKYYNSSYGGKYDNSEESIRKADIIIDGLYGIGAKGRLPEKILYIIEQVNRANKYCISVVYLLILVQYLEMQLKQMRSVRQFFQAAAESCLPWMFCNKLINSSYEQYAVLQIWITFSLYDMLTNKVLSLFLNSFICKLERYGGMLFISCPNNFNRLKILISCTEYKTYFKLFFGLEARYNLLSNSFIKSLATK